MFWGSLIFEFIGVLIRYLVQLVIYFITKKKLKSFKEVWNGPDVEDPINFVSYGFSNILIGMAALFIFILLTIYAF